MTRRLDSVIQKWQGLIRLDGLWTAGVDSSFENLMPFIVQLMYISTHLWPVKKTVAFLFEALPFCVFLDDWFVNRFYWWWLVEIQEKIYIIWILYNHLKNNHVFIFEEKTSVFRNIVINQFEQTFIEQFYSHHRYNAGLLIALSFIWHNFVSFSSGRKTTSPLNFHTVKISPLYKIFF